MTRSIAAASVLALVLITAASGRALACWWECEEPGPFEPPPVYVYDHSTGPTWTGNGWAYLPIGQYYPRPGVVVPPPPPPADHVPGPHQDPLRWLHRLVPF